MSNQELNHDDHLLNLLADQAVSGLDPSQASELKQLITIAEHPVDVDGMELAAAAAYRVFEERAGAVHQPMPNELSKKLIARGEAWVLSCADSTE